MHGIADIGPGSKPDVLDVRPPARRMTRDTHAAASIVRESTGCTKHITSCLVQLGTLICCASVHIPLVALLALCQVHTSVKTALRRGLHITHQATALRNWYSVPLLTCWHMGLHGSALCKSAFTEL